MKVKDGTYEKVPLSDEERDLLLYIYRKRRKYLLVVYVFFAALVLFYSPPGSGVRSRYSKRAYSYDDSQDAKYVSYGWMWLINLAFVGGSVMGTGVYFYMKRVRPFKKDADSGVKEKVPYTVLRREYFEFTGQYYVALDDPNYLHHEIDQEMYYNISEGDSIYLYRATRSKFVFERNGRFTIL